MNNPDLPYRQALERLSQKQYYNFTEVRRLLTEAASADHPAATFELAKHLMNADSPHQDREQGMEMLRIAAEQGASLCALQFGIYPRIGRRAPGNPDTALQASGRSRPARSASPPDVPSVRVPTF
ncbi:hypothetical protein BUM60_001282 [Neisseria gonorrhoeae]